MARTYRYGLTALSILAVVLAGTLLAGPSAAAAPAGVLDLTCTPPSSGVSTYNPPLTNTQQMVATTITYQLGPCVSAKAPQVTAGTAVLNNAPRLRSCLELLGSSSRTLVITWNTGQTSTLSLNVTASVVGAVLQTILTGTVTAGLFQGDTVAMDQTGPAATVLTCTAGLGTVPSIYALVTLEITSV
ncbi:hypothetical protein E2C11_15405 [Streptomyces lavendulae]|uniref:hypothetical protein n=1 Tax=Streptomyces sp. NPDC047813 TaxID=3154608 RepID=UPI0011CD8E3F|nr:hypothetical protein [Streptomyces lavendulae]TXJ78755.1 hypothetical protein E2C11_15405 [Streptomyces lavendulae]